MEIEKGTQVLWYDTVGRIPIRIGIPIELTAPEAMAALEEFVSFSGPAGSLAACRQGDSGGGLQTSK
jgi:hypothetical protein